MFQIIDWKVVLILNDIGTHQQGQTDPAIEDDKTIFKVDGRDGMYTRTVSMHEKYDARPKALENLTLSQFATSFAKCAKLPKGYKLIDNITKETGNIADYVSGEALPLFIKLSNGEIFRLRKFSTILRIHASSKKEGLEELFAEMQLFFPLREKDLQV